MAEEARLESVYTSKAYRGFESPSLRNKSCKSKDLHDFFYSISIFSLVFFLWFASLFHVPLQLSYRTWTTSIQKQYLGKGYVINEKWHDYPPVHTIDIDRKNGTKGKKTGVIWRLLRYYEVKA